MTPAEIIRVNKSKLANFRRAAIRVREHDDDSPDTYDALFVAGHLAPDMLAVIDALQSIIEENKQ